MKQFFKFKNLLVFVTVALVCAFSQANDEDQVVSTFGGNPFLVVTPSESGASQRAPGIYIRDRQGNWRLIIDGIIQADPLRGPVQEQLEITKITRRFEVVVILDGRVTVFHALSKKEDPDSVLSFGSVETAVIEPLTDSPINMPLIESSEDVNIHPLEINNKGNQVILVSLRSSSPMGDGITYAFVLKASSEENDARIETVGQPYVLNYRFMKHSELALLGAPGNKTPAVYSELLLNRATKSHPNDHPGLAQWKQQVRQEMQKEDPSGLPYFDLQKGELIIPEKPKVTVVDTSEYKVTQVYDPQDGQHYLHVKNPKTNKSEYISGLIDPQEEMPLKYKSFKVASSNGHIISVNNTLLFIGNDEENLQVFKLFRSPDDPIAKVSAKHVRLSQVLGSDTQRGARFRQKYLLSIQYESGKESTEHVVVEHHAGESQLLKREKLTSTYYDEDELSIRTHANSKDPQHDGFDIFSKSVTNMKEHGQQWNNTNPLIALSDEKDSGKDIIFIEPLAAYELAKDRHYMAFDDSRFQERSTGIYDKHLKENKLMLPGLLLNKIDSDNQITPTFEANMKLKDLGVIALKAYLFDIQFQGENADDTSLVIFPEAVSQLGRPFDLKRMIALRLGVPYKEISNIGLVRGYGASRNVFYVIYETEKTYADKSTEQDLVRLDTHMVQVKIKPDANTGKVDFSQGSSIRLNFDFDEVMSGVFYDKKGRPYITTTPDLDETDHDFRAVPLHSHNSQVQPNTPGSKGLKLRRWEENTEDQNQVSDTFSGARGSWMLHGGVSSRPDLKALISNPTASFNPAIFPNLDVILRKIASPHEESEQTILVVPERLKLQIKSLLFGSWTRSTTEESPWSAANRQLKLYAVAPNTGAQVEVMENLESLKKLGSGDRATALFADMEDVLKLGRVKGSEYNEEEDFKINGIPANIYKPEENEEESENQDEHPTGSLTDTGQDKDEADAFGEQEDIATTEDWPHLMYLMATGGRRIELNEFAEFTPTHNHSTLILATAGELERLRDDARMEMPYGLMDKFDIVELEEPTKETFKILLERFLQQPAISDLRYQYNAENIHSQVDSLSSAEARDSVLSYLVSRADSLAENEGMDRFVAFTKLMKVLRSTLTGDEKVRREREINRYVVEKCLGQVFDVPINISLLPKDDPLKILSQQNAVLKFSEYYDGPFDLKSRFIDTILNQTKTDDVRPVSSSQIIVGEPRTGKTQLFMSLVEMLDLQLYDFSRADSTENKRAQAIIFDVAKIVKSKENIGSADEMMTIDEALGHLDHFLTLPEGYRGYILIDDIHEASDEVKEKLVSRIRSLVEAKGGVFRAKSAYTKAAVEKRARNLNVFMTMNVSSNQETINKFRKDKGRPPSMEELILATLSTSSKTVESSLLRRFSNIINLMQFPPEAIGPQLMDKTRSAAKTFFFNSQRMVLVSPPVVQNIASEFNKSDATILSDGPRALLNQADQAQGGSGVYIVIPRLRNQANSEEDSLWAQATESSKVGQYVTAHTQAVPLESHLGKVSLLTYLTHNFRIRVFENLIRAMNSHPGLMGSEQAQEYVAAPIFHALFKHLSDQGSLKTSELNVDPTELGFKNPAQRREFANLLSTDGNQPPEMGASLVNDPPELGYDSYRSFVDSGYTGKKERSRADVIQETIGKVEDILREDLKKRLQIKSLQETPTAEGWLQNLAVDDDASPSNDSGKKLLQVFVEFVERLDDNSLIERRTTGTVAEMSFYDRMRLFGLIIDRSLKNIQWGTPLKFLSQVLVETARNMGVGQSKAVQEFLFEDRNSIIRPVTVDLALQMLSSAPQFQKWDSQVAQNGDRAFADNCAKFLVGPSSGGEQ